MRQQRNTVEEVNDYIKAHRCGTIVGVDEAGRGCWAGPLYAAAVAVPTSLKLPPEVTDSKTFGSKEDGRIRMEVIYERYKDDDQVVIGIGSASAFAIDEIGLDKAQAIAQRNAIQNLFHRLVYNPFVVVDGINPPAIDTSSVEKIMCVPKADALIPVVGLASICAKVAQVRAMREFDKKYPGYGFAKHCAYGTKDHKAAVEKLGPCSIHRQSFKPIREANTSRESAMNTDLDELLNELTKT